MVKDKLEYVNIKKKRGFMERIDKLKRSLGYFFGILFIIFGFYNIFLSVKGSGDIEVYTGKMILEWGAEDSDFEIYVDTPVLIRVVEMYQYMDDGEEVFKCYK